MNIRITTVLLIAGSITSSYAEMPYTGKQKAILLINSLDGSPYNTTAPHFDIDPLFSLQHSLLAHPGLPAFATAFVSHNPCVATMNAYINPAALEKTELYPFIKHAESLTLQEHLCGVQLGQSLSQENIEIGWNWWIGARQRNWWIPYAQWTEAEKALNDYSASPTRHIQSDRMPKQIETHRLTYWHATNTTVGIGDVHVHLRYRIPLSTRVFCSIGAYCTVPVGSRPQRTTTPDEHDLPPLNGDELALRLINRARDVMLSPAMGSNGHIGIGGQATAGLALTRHWSLRGQFTQVYYRSATESRFALAPLTPLTRLEEGMPGTMEGISSDSEIIAHLKQTLYPTEIKVEIKPGMVRTAHIGLYCEGMPFYGSLGYSLEHTGAEYSETAPLVTLTRSVRENHKLVSTLGWRIRHDWGEVSWYGVGSYTTAGLSQGAWNAGIGVSVQG